MNKKIRKKHYLKAAENIFNSNDEHGLNFICGQLRKLSEYKIPYYKLFQHYPELELFKPKNYDPCVFWFPESGINAKNKRIMILLFCAAMCD